MFCRSSRKVALSVVLPVVALLMLSGCTGGAPAGWEHIRDGIPENIFTGEDHI